MRGVSGGRRSLGSLALLAILAGGAAPLAGTVEAAERPALADPGSPIGPFDWPQWGGSSLRNNTPTGRDIPTDWDVGKFDRELGAYLPQTRRNVRWVAELGTVTYGTPVVAGGKVFIGTNNGGGRLPRYPKETDLGCLLCFNESDGEFLWQHSVQKLSTGLLHDWPLCGICSTPLVEGDRLWLVTNRGEVVCLDAEGYRDGEDDGLPEADEALRGDARESDTIWSFDMMARLGTRQHNMAACSVTAAGDLLFVNTSNGVDESHENIPAPTAPSFIALDKRTGEVVWTDNSPGVNIRHGQWSSPAYGEPGGVPQVLFAGGDGWLYSFDPAGDGQGGGRLLWKFYCNPGLPPPHLPRGAARRRMNYAIGMPVLHNDLVYIAMGEDPDRGEGPGDLWCIDPTRRSDGSDVSELLPPLPQGGELPRENPASAAVWHYDQVDRNQDGRFTFDEILHRSIGTPAIQNGLLIVVDFSGLVHCLDAADGTPHWTCDLKGACWSSPLIVEDKVYIPDEDGDVAILGLSANPAVALTRDTKGRPAPLHEMRMGNGVYTTPIVANNILYVANRRFLFAIQNDAPRPE